MFDGSQISRSAEEGEDLNVNSLIIETAVSMTGTSFTLFVTHYVELSTLNTRNFFLTAKPFYDSLRTINKDRRGPTGDRWWLSKPGSFVHTD